jgi:regulator of nucleoside diphosphate kinase
MTMTLPIYITENDARRLRPLAQSATLQRGPDAENLKRLEAELARARIVPEHELPADVITMNSTVELEDLTDGERFTYTLVFPEHADADHGRISILAPLGTAMLGYRVGDEFEWPMPGGLVRVRVLRLVGRANPQATPSAVPIGTDGQ